MPDSLVQALKRLKLYFFRVRLMNCQLRELTLLFFHFNFLLSHQTDDILILQCNLQGMLESTGGQLRVGADQPMMVHVCVGGCF